MQRGKPKISLILMLSDGLCDEYFNPPFNGCLNSAIPKEHLARRPHKTALHVHILCCSTELVAKTSKPARAAYCPKKRAAHIATECNTDCKEQCKIMNRLPDVRAVSPRDPGRNAQDYRVVIIISIQHYHVFPG